MELVQTIRVGNNGCKLISMDNSDMWRIEHENFVIENIDFRTAYQKLKELDVEPSELYASLEEMAKREHNVAYFGSFGSLLFTKYEEQNR